MTFLFHFLLKSLDLHMVDQELPTNLLLKNIHTNPAHFQATKSHPGTEAFTLDNVVNGTLISELLFSL